MHWNLQKTAEPGDDRLRSETALSELLSTLFPIEWQGIKWGETEKKESTDKKTTLEYSLMGDGDRVQTFEQKNDRRLVLEVTRVKP